MREQTLQKPIISRWRVAGWQPRWVRIAPLLTLLAVLMAWQGVAAAGIYPAFIVPAPAEVFTKFRDVLADGTLLKHGWATLQAVLGGLLVGAAAGVGLGVLLAKSRVLEASLSPLIAVFQATPVVAYAPLLVIWFGSGPTSKVVTSALIVFFPVLMNTMIGIQSVPHALRDLMQALEASRWQTFTKLEVPAAMPALAGGLKIAATLSVIGAVVGEFVSANAGLGFLINLARSQYDTPLVITAMLALMAMARLLYGTATWFERRALAWRARGR
jgi:NitT/TauT family transport system permease protein